MWHGLHDIEKHAIDALSKDAKYVNPVRRVSQHVKRAVHTAQVIISSSSEEADESLPVVDAQIASRANAPQRPPHSRIDLRKVQRPWGATPRAGTMS